MNSTTNPPASSRHLFVVHIGLTLIIMMTYSFIMYRLKEIDRHIGRLEHALIQQSSQSAVVRP